MRFWKRSKRQPDTVHLPHRDVGAAIEIEANKEALSEMAEKAKAANRRANDRLEENHFTFKIYAAAGGSQMNFRQ